MNNKPKGKFPLRYLLFVLTFICMALLTVTFLYGNVYQTVKDHVDSFLMPVQIGLNRIGGTLSDKSEEYRTLSEAQEENERLKERIAELEEQNLSLYQQTYELTELRSLLGLKGQYENYDMIGASVIQKETGNWFHEFVIDKGSEDGVFLNANVIANGALIGRVTYVGKNYSRVISLISDESNIGAMSLETKDFCIVAGSLEEYQNGRLRFGYADKDSTLGVGNLLVTSNLSEIYLPGIAIGYVESVGMDASNLSRSGYVVPIADFNNIQKVLVITTEKIDGLQYEEYTSSTQAETAEAGTEAAGEAGETGGETAAETTAAAEAPAA